MRVLIIRLWADELNIKNYNCQEIGLAKALVRKGHECDIVLYTKSNNRVEVYEFGDKYKINIYYMKAKNILNNCIYDKKIFDIIQRYDVIQSSEYDQIFNLRLFKKLGNKLIIYHGPYESNYTRGYKIKCLISDFIYMFYKKYKRVNCITKSKLATQFLMKKKFQNIYTIGVGLDIDRLYSKNFKSEYNDLLKKKEKKLLYVGKIEKRRNIEFLLNVYNECKKKNNDISLIIIGTGKGRYYKKIIDKINRLDGIIHIEKLTQSQLSEFYQKSDLFLLPTSYEIFGMVLLESMLFSLPVVTTINGGSSMLIENRKNGFILPLDVNAWSDTILNYIIFNNKDMKSICKKIILEKYDWDKLVELFIAVYKKNM